MANPVTREMFDTLRARILAALESGAARAANNHDARLEEDKAVSTALKSNAVKRAIKSEAALKPLVEAATQGIKEDPQRAKAANEMLKMLQQQAAVELERLARTLGEANPPR